MHGRPAAPRHAEPLAAAGHPRRRRPRRRGARRPDAADRLQRRRPGDAGPGHLRTDRGQPLPGQDHRRRVRPAALPGVADPLTLPAARRQGTGAPDGPPPDPQPRPAAAGPSAGRAGPHPRRDRLPAGRGSIQNALRLFTRAMRPLALRSADQERSSTAVVRHVGRSSGRTYQTPVIAARHDDSFLIALPYGQRTDWLKNVLGKGSATIVTGGQTYEVDRPEVIPMTEATAYFRPRGAAHAPAVPRGLCPPRLSTPRSRRTW